MAVPGFGTDELTQYSLAAKGDQVSVHVLRVEAEV